MSATAAHHVQTTQLCCHQTDKVSYSQSGLLCFQDKTWICRDLAPSLYLQIIREKDSAM